MRAVRGAVVVFAGLLALRFVSVWLIEGRVRAQGDLAIVRPEAPVSLAPGDPFRVAWSDSRADRSPVSVFLRRDADGSLRELTSLRSTGDASADVFDSFLTSDVAPGRYVFVLRSFNGAVESRSPFVDVSDGGAPRGQVRVLSPPTSAGQFPMFRAGDQVDVVWDYPAGPARPVRLDLDIYAYSRWMASHEIAHDVVPAAGTFASQTRFSWSVSSLSGCVPPEARYKVRIVATDGTVGQSADFFLLQGLGNVDTSGCGGEPEPTPTPTPMPTPTPTPSPSADPANLVRNGSFEEAGAGIPDWTVKVEAPALAGVALDATAAFQGTNALRFDIVQPPPADRPWLLQLSSTTELPLRGDRRYRLSFAGRAEAAGEVHVFLQQNQPPWRVFFERRVSVGGSWSRATLDVDGASVPPAPEPVALRFNLPLAGKVWLDDVRYGEVTSPPPDPVDPQPLGPGGTWRLVFRDEFSGTQMDATRWVNCYLWDPYGCFKTFGSEAEWYVPQNVSVADGNLRILAKREPQPIVGSDGSQNGFSSGIVSTGKDHGKADPAVAPRFGFRYGFVEARLKLPRNPGEPRSSVGFWPAFWMLPVQPNPHVASQGDYEYDILEMFGQPYRAYMTVHWPSPDGSFSQDGSFLDIVPPDFTDDFHVFGLEWQSDSITWYVDGQPRKVFSDASRLYQGPMYVLLNLAIGGFSGDPEQATFPAELRADYVRVWQSP